MRFLNLAAILSPDLESQYSKPKHFLAKLSLKQITRNFLIYIAAAFQQSQVKLRGKNLAQPAILWMNFSLPGLNDSPSPAGPMCKIIVSPTLDLIFILYVKVPRKPSI